MSHLVSYKWFRKTQVIPEYVVFYKKWEDCGGCLTYEELSGSYLQEMMGEGVYSLYVTP